MAISFTRPDPSSPAAVSTANFSQSRRGYEPEEVREFLRMVAAELARLQEREKFLERELRVSQRNAPSASVALDEEVVTRMLGEEAARILSTAREAATQIKMRAEDGAARVLREATDEAQRVREEAEIESARRRQDAASDAESELQMAKQQGRDMVNEARAYRERVLGELARRREMARQQIEQLVHGRDRLLNAFERARIAAVDVMAEMTPLGEPNEYVNLSPTTGPVPLMVARESVSPALPPDSEPDLAVEALENLDTAEIVENLETVEIVEIVEIVDDSEPADADLVAIEAEETAAQHEQMDVPVEDVPVDDVPVDDLPADDSGDGELANVVALFGGGDEPADEAEDAVADEIVAGSHDETLADETLADETLADETLASVDDLFARLRASRAQSVIERAVAAPPADDLSVFEASPKAPEVVAEADDTPFGRRDAELTPLIVAGARKLKRVLADEQNDVLHILRRSQPVASLAALLPSESEHLLRYATAVEGELRLAALAGAASVDQGDKGDHLHEINRAKALQPAIDGLAATVLLPLRARMERVVSDADGDNAEMVEAVRAVYREWKTQRIDEHLDDVARLAFGRGALVVLTPGTPVCWTVDPNGPACPDAEDNALAGVVGAGDAFPTDHTCAPAHEGCRCMLQQAPR